MNSVLTLILFPLVMAVLLFLIRNDKLRSMLVRLGAIVTIALTLLVIYRYFNKGISLSLAYREVIGYCTAAVEALIAVYIIIIGIKNKKYLVSLFALFQSSLILWFEFTQAGVVHAVSTDILVDKLAIIMLFIVGVIGGLICLYAAGYMKAYHEKHKEYKERKSMFFALIFLFLGAMSGLIVSNNLMFLYFFWEITTLCSFWLIGYTRTEEAKNNAYRALVINLGGGLAFAAGIVTAGIQLNTLELSELIQMEPGLTVMIPVFLFSFAALTKSAQLPFSSWLLGAMVAPTPTSALLHSATMVKAGVYLIIRLAPLLGTTSVGIIITLVGTITFLIASFRAVAQSDGKKILAYSTIANLGLIVACAGIGTQGSLWAAIMLVIFHAVCKSLLFLSTGAAEHQLGSRNVEDMDILGDVSREVSLYMIIGIAGMFLAPFGVLISKWAAIKAFVDAGNIYALIVIVFGSAITLFYWTKWMGKLVSGANNKEIERQKIHFDEKVPLFLHGVLVMAACLLFPFISKYGLIPFLTDLFGIEAVIPIGTGDTYLMFIMLAVVLVFPLSYYIFTRKNNNREVPIYMAGLNTGDNENFIGSAGVTRKAELKNWYMEDYFGNEKFMLWSNILCTVVLCVGALLLIGGVV